MSGADLKQWESQNCCGQGMDFINVIKTAIDERRYANIPVGANVTSTKWSELEWKQDHTEAELLLKHSHRTNVFRLSKTFAEKMPWLAIKNNKLWSVGTHLKFSYPNHARPQSELSNNEPSKIDGDWLYLSALTDWRFLNLNTAFQ